MIDQKSAKEAIVKLVSQGRATHEDAAKYTKGVDGGLSYAAAVVLELGEEVGMLYLQEEYLEALENEKRRVPLDKLSVPEVLLLENEEPWHKGTFSLLPGRKKFEHEAAEPWHPSLRKKYVPDPEVSDWFNRHPAYYDVMGRILATVYAGKDPDERDIARLGQKR